MSDTPEMAEWKRRYGFSPTESVNHDELRMFAQEAKSRAKSWCFGCDKRMRVCEMKLITRRLNPYVQIDEGETDYIATPNRIRMCPECFKREHEEGEGR